MSESILMALVQLFAIVAAAGKTRQGGNPREILSAYLQRHLNQHEQEEYLKLFDELLFFHMPLDDTPSDPDITLQKIRQISAKVNRELKQREKIIVFLSFIEFVEEGLEEDVPFHYFRAVASTFNFDDQETDDILNFIFDPFGEKMRKEKILIISSNEETDGYNSIKRELLDGLVLVLHLDSTKTFIGRYRGNDTLFLNGHSIFPNRSFFFDNGDILKSQKIQPVYYSDISKFFQVSREQVHISFTARDIEFHFRNSTKGIQQFSFTAESGELVGVMGGSGVGKSTLLNLLNGTIKPEKGNLTINGYDLHKDQKILKGCIGFVPQDDLLIEELTVYENLLFNAKLCFNGLSLEKLNELVKKTLTDIDLLESSSLKVGDPLNKTISGGQRKRLNIALELIRQPAILFADEPTSGLSSMDSEMVMTLLKEQTLKGKMVFVNIHQPSSDIFRMFDKLLIMDKGGYPVYYGNPIEAVSYFKKASNHVNPDESECLTCGYINPEQILTIIEAKLLNESGKITPRRKIAPNEWYSFFRKKIQPELKINDEKGIIPKSFLSVPDGLKQFLIFTHRNILTKISNRQYLIITLAEAPLLAALLAFLTRYRQGSGYVFGDNRNLVAYLFMSVVVSLFLGMMISAEEIIRDRRLLKREAFLHLSRFSYINSKIIFLFFLSAVQSFLYILTGNLILGIHDMMFGFWFILFSTSCVANMIGLNVSAGMNSVVAIYITIPFLIVPQLLLSGTVVSFDNLNPDISSRRHVPLIGDIMPSRWAFEALAVEQFKNNGYEKIFFPSDQEISKYSYITAYQIPYLQSVLDEAEGSINLKGTSTETSGRLQLVINEASVLMGHKINPGITGSDRIRNLRSILDTISRNYSARLVKATTVRDHLYNKLSSEMGHDGIIGLRQENYNENLAQLVLNAGAEDKVIEEDGQLIRKKDPVFMIPGYHDGRAHLYAPVKVIGNFSIETFWFNTAILWLMSLVLYIALSTDLLRRISEIRLRMSFREDNQAG